MSVDMSISRRCCEFRRRPLEECERHDDPGSPSETFHGTRHGTTAATAAAATCVLCSDCSLLSRTAAGATQLQRQRRWKETTVRGLRGFLSAVRIHLHATAVRPVECEMVHCA